MALQKKTISKETAKLRLQSLCARSEYCAYELVTKMKKWGLHSSEISTILSELDAENFINEERYAKAYVRSKLVYNSWGIYKIKLGLYSKHIDRNIIQDTINDIDTEQYRKILKHILSQKAHTLNDINLYENKVKLYKFAINRGFESSLISSLIKEIIAEINEEDCE